MEFEDEEYKQFLQDLQQYPNYFQMGTENCSSNVWRKIAPKIEDEKEYEQIVELSDLVRIKNHNLEACASYYLGNVDKAEHIISKVLEDTNSSSINACAMMAILRYRKGDITKAKRYLSRIKELAADPYNIDVAKSELAYAYTRLNPIFYKKAIAFYTEVVERNPSNIPWKFDLAVLYRRCLKTPIQAMVRDLRIKTCFNEAQKYLTYVLQNSTDEQHHFYKARSYIELADLYSVANTTRLIYTDTHTIIGIVHKGVECLPENTTILRKAGKILRHSFKFVEAEELLQKAYNICPNSFICHQLGLIQTKRIIHYHKKSQQYTKRDQRHTNKWNREFGSRMGPSYSSTSAPEQTCTKPQVNEQLEPEPNQLISLSKQAFTETKPIPKLNKDTTLKPDEDIKPILKPDEDTKPILKPGEDIHNTTVHVHDIEEDLAIEEPVYQHSFPHGSPFQSTLKQLDPAHRGSTLLDSPTCPIGSPDPFGPKSWIEFDKGVEDYDLDPERKPDHRQLSFGNAALDDPSKTMATGSPTIKPNESNTENKLADTLSNLSLTHTARESSLSQTPPVSKMFEDVSSGQTSTIEKSGLQNNPVVKMTRLINSPKNETFDLELSRKLDPYLDLFRQSAELGHEQNLDVYYDWGITLLQMIPTKFDEVMEKFNHILAKDRSQFLRYRCYEQYGICKLRMSESQDFEKISREDYREDAMEMFRRAIRCWAYCQKLNLSEHFDDAEGNCNSLRSIREIIFGEKPRHGTKPKRDMASLYYLVKQYGSSLSLYQEVYDELQRTSDTAMDSEVIKGIIRNHLQLQQYTGILDMLALLLCSKERPQCLDFKTEVLTQMMHHSIDTNDCHLSESVFGFEKDPNEEVHNDIAIIFNEEDQVSKKKGATLKKWLCDLSNSGLKVIQITETAANLPKQQSQINLICKSKMVIFILANETPSTELTYLMNTAIEARLDNNYFLKKIFPIVINDGMVPNIFKIFRSMKITHQPNTLEEQDKSVFLKTFSDVFLEKAT